MFDTPAVLYFGESLTDVGRSDQSLTQGGHLPAADARSDGALAESIARALRKTGYPALRSLHVEVHRSAVVLNGRVPTYHQKQLAQATVQTVDGVCTIANEIEVYCCS